MMPLEITAFDLAQRYIGLREVPGVKDNPTVLAMLKLDQDWPEHDETPWCSAYCNWICWHLRLPRSKDLRARSWLRVGIPVPLDQAEVGFDVVILSRGENQPPANIIDAPGHVGFFAGLNADAQTVSLLGGNQGNQVSVASFPVSRVLGVRRLRA